MSVVSVVCCQVEVSAIELITRPDESYRLCCVVVCDLETSRMGDPYIYIYIYIYTHICDISSLRVNYSSDFTLTEILRPKSKHIPVYRFKDVKTFNLSERPQRQKSTASGTITLLRSIPPINLFLP